MKTFQHIRNCFTVLFFVLLSGGMSSCHKEGIGGNASISGTVYHHDEPIPNCVVYIKFNASDFPGDDQTDYNTSVTADASGHFEFTKLYKGEYYLFGKGYDNKIMAIVKGGIPVKIKRNKVITQDVPVTED